MRPRFLGAPVPALPLASEPMDAAGRLQRGGACGVLGALPPRLPAPRGFGRRRPSGRNPVPSQPAEEPGDAAGGAGPASPRRGDAVGVSPIEADRA